MSGYRTLYGIGNIPREVEGVSVAGTVASFSSLPTGGGMEGKIYKTNQGDTSNPAGIYICTGRAGTTNTWVLVTSGRDTVDMLPGNLSAKDALWFLTGRVGGGVSLEVKMNLNTNHDYDMGQREATVTTQGLLDLSFTMEGMIMPRHSSWLKYAFSSEPMVLKSNSVFTAVNGSGDTAIGTVRTDNVVQPGKIVKKEFDSKKPASGATKVEIFSYVELDGPMTFDMAVVKYNKKVGSKKNNEIEILCGCIIDSLTINYENATDATVKFSASGSALCNPRQTLPVGPDFIDKIEPLRGDVFITGCLSAGGEPIAFTDKADLSIGGNVSKLAGCGKKWYSGYSFAQLEYSLSTQTYSDDADKYMAKMYGMNAFTEGVTTLPAKKPYLIPDMRIRTDHTSASDTEYLEIMMENVAIQNLDRRYSVQDGAIYDAPTLKPRKVKIAICSSTA